MIVSETVEMGGNRRRAVAMSVCLAAVRDHSFSHVNRVSSAEDLASLGLIKGRTLLWLDLVATTKQSDVVQFDQACTQLLEDSTGARFLLTCDDDLSVDQHKLENLEETLEIAEPIDIGAEKGVSNIRADQLHEEFKLMSTFAASQSDSRAHCLLEVFGATKLVQAIRQQLHSRPLVAVYYGNSNDVLVRICVSDVGYMHELRDKLLQGVFCGELQQALESTPRLGGLESLGGLTITVDKSHFAQMYEDSILTLNQLTPHQRGKLDECFRTLNVSSAGKAAVHIKAPAGAGKTFLALHFMQDILKDKDSGDKTKLPRVLFVARNPPLAVAVAKWLAKRFGARTDTVRRRVLSRLHVMSAPLAAGPHTVSIVKAVDGFSTLETAPVHEPHWGAADLTTYDLIV
eukprot:SAG25_NODE_2484_length_1577_cov_1.236806_2_plen_401_part_01